MDWFIAYVVGLVLFFGIGLAIATVFDLFDIDDDESMGLIFGAIIWPLSTALLIIAGLCYVAFKFFERLLLRLKTSVERRAEKRRDRKARKAARSV